MIALLKNKSIYIPLFVDWRGDGPNDCRVLAGGSGGKLLIAFDKELLRDSKLIVQSYDTTHPNRSAFLALANTSATTQAWVPLNSNCPAQSIMIIYDRTFFSEIACL